MGGADAVARRIAESGVPNAAEIASGLVSTANQAFVDALHSGVLVAAIPTAVGVIMALVFLPAHARRPDLEIQEHEYVEGHAGDASAAALGFDDTDSPSSPSSASSATPAPVPPFADG